MTPDSSSGSQVCEAFSFRIAFSIPGSGTMRTLRAEELEGPDVTAIISLGRVISADAEIGAAFSFRLLRIFGLFPCCMKVQVSLTTALAPTPPTHMEAEVHAGLPGTDMQMAGGSAVPALAAPCAREAVQDEVHLVGFRQAYPVRGQKPVGYRARVGRHIGLTMQEVLQHQLYLFAQGLLQRGLRHLLKALLHEGHGLAAVDIVALREDGLPGKLQGLSNAGTSLG
mmetsp:Transcript_124603/g.265783  ORF Transcript_124603/g.265783 Transcript_124603/m.265783 type:complete len:226 (+) Transcript_124603:1532-2209(+)